MLIELIGIIGAIAYTVCNVPLVLRARRTGDTSGLPWAFLHLWSLGNVSFLINSIAYQNVPLIVDYTLNGFILAYIYYIKINHGSKETD